MVRYSLYQGGRRPIFALDKLCVCRQEFMLYCFNDVTRVSMAVAGETFVRVTSRSLAFYLPQLFLALMARLL